MKREGTHRVSNNLRGRDHKNRNEETTMNKMLAGLLLGGALVVSVNNWLPTEARMAENELLRVEAKSAQIEDEFLPVDTRTAQANDEVLPVEARFA